MMTQQRLMRSSDDKVIGGVCGGLGHYFGIDPVIVRLVMVALVFAGGVSLLIYPVMWLVMPAQGATQPSFGESFQDMQRQAHTFGQQAGEQAQAVFGAPRFDPQTGQPIDMTERRNRTLGLVLLGVGVLMLASYFGSGQLALALMIVAGGFYLLRRRQPQS
jgi:phage shock protein C